MLRRRAGERSEGGRRGLGPPREMIENFLDHRRIFDARDHLDRTTTLAAGLDIDLKHALQPLRPCHRDVARGHGLIGGLCLASATSGRGDLLTQSMIRREHPVIARGVDARGGHQGGQGIPGPSARLRITAPFGHQSLGRRYATTPFNSL